MRTYLQIYKSAQYALASAVLITSMVLATYMAFEPIVGRTAAQAQDFTVKQTIGDEISFNTVSNVTMSGSISGLTGGYATGTTHVVVNTNAINGYNITIAFASTTGSAGVSGMAGEASTDDIGAYTPAAFGVPDYGFVDNASGGASQFGYTVTASTTDDLDLTFQNNGTACATAGVDTPDQCWLNASTTAERIMFTSAATPSGSTTTIRFKVSVPNAPNPSLTTDTYTATATLTATTNP